MNLSNAFKMAGTDTRLLAIADKVQSNERITDDEGLYLFEKGEMGFVGALANHIAEQLHHGKVYFNRNFHIEQPRLSMLEGKTNQCADSMT